MTNPQPIVCTLTDGERAERSLEWSDIGDLSISCERIDGGVASTFPLELAERIEDLANREMSCCGSWLDTATSRSDVMRLEITTTNPDGLELIAKMAGLSD